MTPERFQELFSLYLRQETTPAEEQLLCTAWQNPEPALDAVKAALLEEAFDQLPVQYPPLPAQSEDIFARVLEDVKTQPAPVHSIKRRWWMAAAVLLILISGGAFYLMKQGKYTGNQQPNLLVNDVAAPASNRARITLADGDQVYLDSAANGTLAVQGSVQIQKTSDGQITYSGSGTETSWNTLYNPPGSKVVSLTLVDGTQVWLNAASSVRYPTAFAGDQRLVEITGEAFLEVSQDAAKPFVVSHNNRLVTVLGTRFNFDAYDDEPAMKVTLVDGSVRVSNGDDHLLLKPGQQAVCKEQIDLNKSPNLQQVLAWKNGVFDFSTQDFAAAMRQLERWYAIKVVYDGPVPTERFGGRMSRNLTLMQVVKVLDGVVANFRFENNTLHILP